ncbi:MAG TPA: hypothetical protein VK743_02570 [Steroidobacteraceae bacterium]|jgi:hypothetical protein|nr:hypothetical protein [Steroidobacteraceae bacterium]
MNDSQGSLARSPELFPHSLDAHGEKIAFIHLRESDYQRASFLDARILTPHTAVYPLTWQQVAAALASANLEERCAFIFHIGHVGSTLLARLIGAHPGAFVLREPLLLRVFAQMNYGLNVQPKWSNDDTTSRLTDTLKLFSRTFESAQTPIIKATSFVSELSTNLMQRPSAPKALLMFVSPESYLATILGGPVSRQEAIALAPDRLRRLHRRIGAEVWRAETLSEGERLALAWACEMSALAQATAAARDRTYPLNFDEFLTDPAGLSKVFRHFDIDATAAEVGAILSGPEMRRYSKAPEYAYDAALRLEVLNEARVHHGSEIRRGLDWLERAAAQFEPVRLALALAASRPA